MPTFLSDELLHAIVAELDDDTTIGWILGGSYARGDATLFSDVDLARFMPDDATLGPRRYLYRDGRLISIATKTIAAWRADFTRPTRAILAVPSMRQSRILLDKSGAIAVLQREADVFDWEPLREAAYSAAGQLLMDSAEWAHKILGALPRHDASSLAYATMWLHLCLADAVALRYGILMESSNTYFREARDATGHESAWARFSRLAAGDTSLAELFALAPTTATIAEAQAIVALSLYRETVALLRPALRDEHRVVVEETMRIIAAAGFPPG
jgi:hypothetical protein